MHMRRIHQRLSTVFGAIIVLSLLVVPAVADSSIGEQWCTYHWPRPSSGKLTVNVHNNTTGSWTTPNATGKTTFTKVVDDWNDPATVTKARWEQFGSQSAQPKVLRDGAAHDPWSGAPPIFLNSQKGATSSKTCKPSAGWIEVCNYAYGKKGWEGIAQI
jgi:hypothetical protein